MQIRQARKEYVQWLAIARDLSPHTLRAYDGDIAALARHLGEHTQISGIDRSSLMAWMQEQRAAGHSPRSLRRRAAGTRGFCRWLVSRRLLDADPWTGIRITAGPSRRLPRVVPRADLDRLLFSLRTNAGLDERAHLDAGLRCPHEVTTLLGVLLMLVTGIRVSEVVSIKCHDIDLSGRSMRLVGKGRRERHVFLTNDWIAQVTSAYLTTRAELSLSHSHLLFNSRYEPLTEAAMRARLANAGRDARLSAKVTPHMLRHTAATQLIEAGVDIRYIQRLLGHASLSTTELYTHVSDSALRRVVSDADILGKLLQPR